MDFNAVFTVRINDERHMWRYELHSPHLITVATLPCKIRNIKNVILQWDIAKENCIKRMLHRNGPVDYKICMGCYATVRVRNKDLWHLWPSKMLGANLDRLWTERYRGWAAIDQWRDSLRSCVLVADILRTCYEIIVYLYYVVHQNILWNRSM